MRPADSGRTSASRLRAATVSIHAVGNPGRFVPTAGKRVLRPFQKPDARTASLRAVRTPSTAHPAPAGDRGSSMAAGRNLFHWCCRLRTADGPLQPSRISRPWTKSSAARSAPAHPSSPVPKEGCPVAMISANRRCRSSPHHQTRPASPCALWNRHSLTVTSMTTPSMPSDPVNNASRSYPGVSSSDCRS